MNPVQRPLENVFKHPPIIMDLAVAPQTRRGIFAFAGLYIELPVLCRVGSGDASKLVTRTAVLLLTVMSSSSAGAVVLESAVI